MSKETIETIESMDKETKAMVRMLQTDWLTLRQRIAFRKVIIWRQARELRVKMASLASKSGGAKPSK